MGLNWLFAALSDLYANSARLYVTRKSITMINVQNLLRRNRVHLHITFVWNSIRKTRTPIKIDVEHSDCWIIFSVYSCDKFRIIFYELNGSSRPIRKRTFKKPTFISLMYVQFYFCRRTEWICIYMHHFYGAV